ncbi:adenylate/guanylate cyclase domain-containing protein [Anaerolineales bacterium HSG6]|nr:adenylate/guanylate cyclase domain-containing protein [Anaerolineales bacterium HSG6]
MQIVPSDIHTQILDHLKIGYLVVDNALMILSCNDTVEHWIEDEYQPIVGQELSMIFPETFGYEDIFAELLTTPQEFFTLSHIHRIIPSNEARYFNLQIKAMSGVPSTLLIIVSDSTEQGHLTQALTQKRNELNLEVLERQRIAKALEKTLLEVEQAKNEWETTAEALFEFVCLLDHEGAILRANRIFEHWELGQLSGIQGRKIEHLFVPYRTDFWQYVWAELAEGRAIDQELEDTALQRFLHIQIRPIAPEKQRLDTTYAAVIIEDITERKQTEQALHDEREKSERLLLNVLPQPIAERLKNNTQKIVDHYDEVTILFADIVGFTELSTKLSPLELLELLNEVFSAFDDLADRYGLEKIKTIGDAYMVVGGLPVPSTDHAERIADMALAMQEVIQSLKTDFSQTIDIRIGINSGPVIAGVIGSKKFIYDLWGDAVNVASRMESHGLVGQIQTTETTQRYLQDKYLLQERGAIRIKGKGEMTTYLLIGRKNNPDYQSEVKLSAS